MKVLHVINSLRTGGAERLVVDLVSEGMRRGQEASILTLMDHPGVPAADAQRLGVDVVTLDGSRFSPRLPGEIRKRAADYDLLHVHLFPALYWSYFSNKPMVFTEHSTRNRRMHRKYWRAPERVVYDRYAKVIAVSNGVRDAITTHFDKIGCSTPISTVPNGVRDAFFDVDLDVRRPDEELRLVAVGSLRPVKNFQLAIRSVAATSRVSLEIAGTGPLYEELQSLIDVLGVRDRVRLLGQVEDVSSLYSRHDALLSTSTHEGFSLVAAEALAAGLPVVGPAVPGFSEVVQHRRSGILYSNKSPAGVRDAINELRQPNVYDFVASNARRSASVFTMRECFDRHLMEYEAVMVGGSSNGSVPWRT